MNLLRRHKKSLSVIAGMVLLVAAALFILAYSSSSDTPARLRPSTSAAYVPEPGDSFADYLHENRRRIREALQQYYFVPGVQPFRGDYTLDEVVQMRAPFEFSPAEDCEQAGQGILMVHGLTDSPYLLRNLGQALAGRYPCARIRALLTPGHGTIPGDLVNVSLEQWRQVFAFGVNSFEDDIDELVVLGYSNGAALALDYLSEPARHEEVDRLVFISPGFRATDTRAWLAPWLRGVLPWASQLEDQDAVKYESFSMNAAAEFYRLTEAIEVNELPEITIPALLIVSGDDTTIDADVTLGLYCGRLRSPRSHLIWYDSVAGSAGAEFPCEGIERRSPLFPEQRVASYSHVALMVPPIDPHYGLDGNYPVCLSYGEDAARYERCMTDPEATVYAEGSLRDEAGTFEGKLIRRTSFNPEFDRMVNDIGCFLDSQTPCQQ